VKLDLIFNFLGIATAGIGPPRSAEKADAIKSAISDEVWFLSGGRVASYYIHNQRRSRIWPPIPRFRFRSGFSDEIHEPVGPGTGSIPKHAGRDRSHPATPPAAWSPAGPSAPPFRAIGRCTNFFAS
jgi:hypothetical protein